MATCLIFVWRLAAPYFFLNHSIHSTLAVPLGKEKLPLSLPIKNWKVLSPSLMFLPFHMGLHHQFLRVPKSVTRVFCFTVGICPINRVFLLLDNILELKICVQNSTVLFSYILYPYLKIFCQYYAGFSDISPLYHHFYYKIRESP